MSRKSLIYLVGIVALGFFYEPLKRTAPNGGVFFIGVVGYLVLLRLFAERLGR